MKLQISRLHIAQVLGVEESTIDLGPVTEISGENASGKSSHMAAIRSVLGIDRTSLARLVHLEDGQPAEDRPEVEVILTGDDCEARIKRRGDGSPEVKLRQGETWSVPPRPGDWLRDLVDSAATPSRWLALSDEDKAREVLEAMHLPGYSRAAALDAAGLPGFRLPAIPEGLHPLEDLEMVERAVFDSRTAVNAEQRREADAATKLLAGLPAQAPGDVAEDLAKAVAIVDELTAALAAQEAAADAEELRARQQAEATYAVATGRIKDEHGSRVAKMRADHAAMAAEGRAEVERRIAEAAAEVESQIEWMRSAGDALLMEADKELSQSLDAAIVARTKARMAWNRLGEELAQGREAVAALRARQASAATDRHVRTTAAMAQTVARAHAERAAHLTEALSALKRYRLELAEKLPVAGLAVKFDDKGRKSLTLDGVPLDQVNRGRLATLAVEVGLLRGTRPDDRPSLPLILLDDAEKLDDATRQALYEECARRGSQIIAAVVSPGPFRVSDGRAA